MSGVPGITKGHTPNVTERDYSGLTLDGNPLELTPVAIETAKSTGLVDSQIDQILDRHYAGEKVTRIAQSVFGYGNPFYIAKVRGVIAEYDNNTNTNDNNSDETD